MIESQISSSQYFQIIDFLNKTFVVSHYLDTLIEQTQSAITNNNNNIGYFQNQNYVRQQDIDASQNGLNHNSYSAAARARIEKHIENKKNDIKSDNEKIAKLQQDNIELHIIKGLLVDLKNTIEFEVDNSVIPNVLNQNKSAATEKNLKKKQRKLKNLLDKI
ncbi:MAG: hypothetical protein H0W88_00160 [Parachlamydiaceae bacterium]|nr:hypothetical protein [Parachlamydiaceae bacterium]